ncbi:MAG: Sir2 family NAD-dependent protein deacetylase, partial [bacterium]
AESSNIIHMHGTLEKIKCTQCAYSRTDLEPIEGIPHCPECNAVLRPDVVWFGEIPYHMGRIHKLLKEASLFIAIGTSGTVYPAAGFIDIARYHGAHIIYINKERIRNPSINHFVKGSAEITVPEVVDEIIADNQTD